MKYTYPAGSYISSDMLFGSSGIRMRYGEDLVNISLRLGSALARCTTEVIVGRDTRTTSPLLFRGLTGALLAAGIDVYDAGLAPTPTIGYGARFVDGGCMITASHNPEEYNGIKLFNPDGSSFTRNQQKDVEKLMDTSGWNSWDMQGMLVPFNAISPHLSAILDRVECKAPIKVLVDCGNGAGSEMTPRVLGEMGAHVIPLNCNPADRFSRSSEPLPENLPYLSDLVRKKAVACAIVHDGDADRMVAMDSKARWISGDHLLMLFASYLGKKEVVTTMDASRAIEDIAEVRRTPVGDAYVSEGLREWGDFGGEASGTWIFPEVSLCPDGIFAGALLCEIATEWNIVEEIDRMPRLSLLRSSIQSEDHFGVLTALGAPVPTDGIRVEKDNGWFLIRASGTEPKIRITAEGGTFPLAKELLREAESLVKEQMKKNKRE
ncbi:MAG: phosphopentomutase/phosphoglucosamine mutase [Methanomicrobiales archaeon]|nr:phosphopentomutase/phosphoglucosamine mutase [Methanomicrobiales archaeon]